MRGRPAGAATPPRARLLAHAPRVMKEPPLPAVSAKVRHPAWGVGTVVEHKRDQALVYYPSHGVSVYHHRDAFVRLGGGGGVVTHKVRP